MKTKYIRLLTYRNACRVIQFIEDNDYGSAYITVGGIAVEVSEDNIVQVDDFIKGLNVRYEITDRHPREIHETIKRNVLRMLKN